MPKNTSDMVVKSNTLIKASYQLTTAEIRLIDIALRELTEFTDNEKIIAIVQGFEVTAEQYAEYCNVDINTAYDALSKASKTLFKREFSYAVEETKQVRKIMHSRWLSQVNYIENTGKVELFFTPELVNLSGQLKKNFTRLHLVHKAPLTSTYAHRLYEMMLQWRSTTTVPAVRYVDLRQQLGIEKDEYNRMSNFKARVLDPAIKQINEHTDITVTYEQYKQGRKIEGFIFKFKFKDTKKDKDTDTSSKDTKPSENKDTSTSNKKIRTIPPLSDKQRNTFAFKLLNNFDFMREVSAQTLGKSREELVLWLEQELADDEKRQKLAKYLVICGYEYPDRHKK